MNFAFSLLINNTGSIVINENEKITQNARHIDIHYHHIRNLIQNSTIEILHILSRDMMMNELTKTLDVIKLKEFCNNFNKCRSEHRFDKNIENSNQ